MSAVMVTAVCLLVVLFNYDGSVFRTIALAVAFICWFVSLMLHFAKEKLK